MPLDIDTDACPMAHSSYPCWKLLGEGTLEQDREHKNLAQTLTAAQEPVRTNSETNEVTG